MAVLSERWSYLYLLAPRTASTATADTLVKQGAGEWIPPDDIEVDGEIVVQRKHSTTGDLIDYGLLPEDRVRDLFVFCTVRNPFDSLVSLWSKKRSEYQPLLDDPDSFVNRLPGFRDDMEFVLNHTFSEWVEERLSDAKPTSMYDGFVEHADAVMRFERLDRDFPQVMRRIGLRRLREIPVLNTTDSRDDDYRRYYTHRARRIVQRVYGPDLDRFGYRF